MEFISKRYESLSDNYKRLVTLGGAVFLTFTVLVLFPLNILMIYSLIRAYSKNKVNLLLGMKEEVLELYEQLKNLRKADSLQSLEKDEELDKNERVSTTDDSTSDLSEEDTKRVIELTSMTEEDVAGIINSVSDSEDVEDINAETKDPILKKDE
jgi:hypothetical protein